MRKVLVNWVPVVVWASLIFTMSSLPTGTASQVVLTDYLIKKTAHMFEYGIFALLVYRAIGGDDFEIDRRGFLAVIAAMFYGTSDEYHQSFIPGRTARPYDVLFDTIGAATAILILWSILQIMPPKLKNWPKRLGVA